MKRDLNRGVALTLPDVKDDIRQIYGSLKAKDHKSGEAILAVKQGFKKTKTDCRTCGRKGHKSADCWDNIKNKDKRPPNYKSPDQRKSKESANVTSSGKTLHCDYCKKDNHTEDRCFKKIKDLKEGKTNKSSSETVEVVMVCMDRSQKEILMTNNDPSKDSMTDNTFIELLVI